MKGKANQRDQLKYFLNLELYPSPGVVQIIQLPLSQLSSLKISKNTQMYVLGFYVSAHLIQFNHHITP